MNQHRRIVGGVLGAGAIVAIVCARSMLGEGSAGPTLRVAALCGETTPDERAVRAGLALAVEALERERGAQPRVELVYRDPAGSGATAAKQLTDLQAEGVTFVVDIVGDDAFRACAQGLRDGKAVATTTNDAPGLQGLGGQRVLRAAAWPSEEARALADWARELRPRRAAVVHAASEVGATQRDSFNQGLAAIGGAEAIPVSDAKAQAAWVARRVGELEADVVALFVEPADAAAIVAALGDRAPANLFTLGAGTGQALASHPSKVGLARLRFVEPEKPAPARAAAVVEAWRASGGQGEPPVRMLAAHDALQLLVRAAWSTGGDPDRTLAIARATVFEGATGRIAFQGDGERVPPAWRRMAFAPEGVAVPWTPAPVGGGS